MLRDVGYARLSHYDPDEAGAIARQKTDIRKVSERSGGTIVAMLADNAISASRYARKKRKDYPLIAEMARAGTVDRAIIYDVDRLLRIPRELEDLIDLVEELDGHFEVVGLHGEMRLDTADGRFFARMRVAQAAKESDDTSRRLKRSYDQAAEAGVPRNGTAGGNRPFGYLDGGMSINELEADLLRRAAADVLGGEGTNAIARRWNEAGVRTPRGQLWTHRTVRRMLVSPRHAGRRIHRGTDVGPAAWEPIVDIETHTALRRIMEARTREPRRRTPFTGLFVTTDGRTMVRDVIGRTKRRVWTTPRSKPGVPAGTSITIGPAEELEEIAVEMIFEAVNSGELGRRIAARRQTRPAAEDPAVIEAELADYAAQKGRGEITAAEWGAYRKPALQRLAQAREAIEAAAAAETLVSVPVDIRDRWDTYSDDRRRAVLHAVFERIEIAPAPRRGPGLDLDRVNPIWSA